MVLAGFAHRHAADRACRSGRSRYADLMILCARIGFNP